MGSLLRRVDRVVFRALGLALSASRFTLGIRRERTEEGRLMQLHHDQASHAPYRDCENARPLRLKTSRAFRASTLRAADAPGGQSRAWPALPQ